MMKDFRLSIAQGHFHSCDLYLLLFIHVVFYCSLRLAPRCLASTLVFSQFVARLDMSLQPGLLDLHGLSFTLKS